MTHHRRIVVNQKYNGTYGGPDWWAAKCAGCGKWLTKFEFTREQAQTHAEAVPCTCPEGAA